MFHKGFARAKDSEGWFHVMRSGRPAYNRRFAMVEPFYNGLARVEVHDGAFEVIDETGATQAQLRTPRRSDLDDLSRDMVGFWRSEVIFAAVDTGLMEELPLPSGGNTPGRTGGFRGRLLAALGELGLVERREGFWVATPRGALLRSDSSTSMRCSALHWASADRSVWLSLRDAVTKPGWQPPKFFDALASSGDVRSYHAAMRPYALHDYREFPRTIAERVGHVVDLGGGTGALAELIISARPDLRVTVVERPEVVKHAAASAVSNDRISFVDGDLFQGPLPTGHAYILARVLHDWGDADALRILAHVRERAQPGVRLHVIELLKPEAGFHGSLLDLHMLLATGGRERTKAEFEHLLGQSGWQLTEVHALPAVCSVIVAEAK